MIEEDIPPAICCAICGRVNCDGCQQSNRVQPQPAGALDDRTLGGRLPWEEDVPKGYFRRLILTALVTAQTDQICFKTTESKFFFRSLHFATIAETLAIVSFAIPWAVGFALIFPELSLQMARSPSVLYLIGVIVSGLVVFVVLLHVFWGVALESAMRIYGTRPNFRLGIRFGLYACGWDLLASPFGVVLLWLFDGREAVIRGLRYARQAPRLSLAAYLDEARRLDPALHRRVIGLTLAIVSAYFLTIVLLVIAYLLWQLLY